MQRKLIYTIGHSTHQAEKFVSLLQRHQVDLLIDVRSIPYSRWNPQYNRENLIKTLQEHSIDYEFLGQELGARSEDSNCYENNRVSYKKLARTPLFQSGIEKIRQLADCRTLALVCAEKEPLVCHRTILVARSLETDEYGVFHILENGEAQTHDQAMDRLCELRKLPEPDLIYSRDQRMNDAYAAQEQRIAYQRPE